MWGHVTFILCSNIAIDPISCSISTLVVSPRLGLWQLCCRTNSFGRGSKQLINFTQIWNIIILFWALKNTFIQQSNFRVDVKKFICALAQNKQYFILTHGFKFKTYPWKKSLVYLLTKKTKCLENQR
jgi:hypothetical protein